MGFRKLERMDDDDGWMGESEGSFVNRKIKISCPLIVLSGAEQQRLNIDQEAHIDHRISAFKNPFSFSFFLLVETRIREILPFSFLGRL